MKNVRLLLFHLLLLLAAYGWCRLIVGARRRAETARTVAESRDTILVRDTVHIDRPVAVREEVVRYVTVSPPTKGRAGADDSSNVHEVGKDSTSGKDSASAPVVLPVTQRVYRDTSYTAWVSGYEPRLDSIEVYPPTLIVTPPPPATAQPRRWSFGLQAGCGLTPRGVQPYIGLGLTLRLHP